MTLTVGSLCSGAGGLDLAVADVLGDVRTAWVADNDPDAASVLDARFGVPNLGDITTVDWTRVEPVDVLCAGFPCQDISNAGQRAGIHGPKSGVWRHVATAIGVLRPRLVLLENVAALLVRGGTRVVGDLAAVGYVGSWRTLRASDVGAPHQRNRVFIVAADPDREPIRVQHEPVGARVAAAVAGGDSPRPDMTRDSRIMLPTPTDRGSAGRGLPGADLAHRRYAQGRRMLDDAVALLPTPNATDAQGGARRPPAVRTHDGPDFGPRLRDVAPLLPTPTSSTGGPGHEGRKGGFNLQTAMDLLPTPAARDFKGVGYRGQLPNALLPTPRATDGAKGGPNQRGSSGDLTLTSSVILLPTPTVTNAHGNGHNNRGEPLLPAVVGDADRWAQYAPAIARWEAVLGRPAPEPTVLGKRGGRRLSARFVEWLMGWPEGWVTDLVDNTAALRMVGNGVCPQQAVVAYRELLR